MHFNQEILQTSIKLGYSLFITISYLEEPLIYYYQQNFNLVKDIIFSRNKSSILVSDSTDFFLPAPKGL